MPENPAFRGIDATAAKNSLPEGFYQSLENIDIYSANRARLRPGLSRLSQNNLAGGIFVGSGDLAYGFNQGPASGEPQTSSWGNFNHFVVSGQLSHPSSGQIIPVHTEQGSPTRLHSVISGAYMTGSLFNPSQSLWALGYDYMESGNGAFHPDGEYVKATWGSGYVPSTGTPGAIAASNLIGLALRINPQTESYYVFVVAPSVTVSPKEIVSFTPYIAAVTSGVYTHWFPPQAFPPVASGGEMMFKIITEDGNNHLFGYINGIEVVNKIHSFGASSHPSGYPGIGGVWTKNATLPIITSWNFLTDWQAGSINTYPDGGIGSLKPSGNTHAFGVQVSRGKPAYIYVDTSGYIMRLESPNYET